MTDTYPAFDMGPVPVPGPDAEPPELFRSIYGMPMFVSVPTGERGLAQWLRDVVDANTLAHGVDPETATWT